MSQKDIKPFLLDISHSIKKILSYTDLLSFQEFLVDDKTKDAVERNFEIIGEAVKRLPLEFKMKNPHIPFKQIAGMRDKFIHDYFGVDYELLWKTIKDKLSTFLEDIEKSL